VKQVLFVGAHPDDIELGAGALLSKLCSNGEDVHALILTDDENSQVRRTEARAGLVMLGMDETRIHFGGFPDGALTADASTVGRVRRITASAGLSPSLIVTHTSADSHNDHVAANRISHAAFRNSNLLHYSIHISAEPSAFLPRIFVKLSNDLVELKENALAAHASQSDRLCKASLPQYEANLSNLTESMVRVEAFEVSWQGGASPDLTEIQALSDSLFHRFWLPVVGQEDRLTLLYEGYDYPGEAIDWPLPEESVGRDALRAAFNSRWSPHTPLHEIPSNTVEAFTVMNSGCALLVGGSVSNRIVRDIYNRLDEVRWVVEHAIPRTTHAFLLNKSTGQMLRPTLDMKGALVHDFGVIAKLVNPISGKPFVFAAGCTGRGTRMALEILADPENYACGPSLVSTDNIEIVFSLNVRTGQIDFDVDGLGFNRRVLWPKVFGWSMWKHLISFFPPWWKR
jgi:LmbE family N-acetylglucosaminyl deacetylase